MKKLVSFALIILMIVNLALPPCSAQAENQITSNELFLEEQTLGDQMITDTDINNSIFENMPRFDHKQQEEMKDLQDEISNLYESWNIHKTTYDEEDNLDIDDSDHLTEFDESYEDMFFEPSSQANVANSTIYKLKPKYLVTNFTFDSMSATVTGSESTFKNIGLFRKSSDLIGMSWQAKDELSYTDFKYPEDNNFSGLTLTYNYNISGYTPRLSGLQAPVLKIETTTGEIYHVRLWNYVVNRPEDGWESGSGYSFPEGRTEGNDNGQSGKIVINFDQLYAGWAPYYWQAKLVGETEEGEPIYEDEWLPSYDWVKVPVNNIKEIMWIFAPNNYTQNSYPLSGSQEYEVNFSNWNVSGNKHLMDEPNKAALLPVKVCDDYDDIYNMTPERVTDEYSYLGYGGIVNMYIGASHFYDKKYDQTEKKLNIIKEYPFNVAFETWYNNYLRRLKNNGVQNVIHSISMENVDPWESWKQRTWNGTAATTGWTPVPSLLSFTNPEVQEFYKKYVTGLAKLSEAQGMNPMIQLGEPWWWFVEDGNANTPCFYDESTKQQYYDLYNKPMHEFKTGNDSIIGHEDVLYFLRDKNGEFSHLLRNALKSEYPTAEFSVLFFPPSVLDKDRVPMMMRIANLPKEHWKYPNLDFFMLEDYDYVIDNQMKKHREALTFVQDNLGYSKKDIHYFAGFVLDESKAEVWDRVHQCINDSINMGMGETYVWAYAQIKRDGWKPQAIITSNKPSGNYTGAQNITLTCASADSIKYTLDGTTPSLSRGSTYGGAINITTSTVITAISIKNGVASKPIEFSYTIPVQDPIKAKIMVDEKDIDWKNITMLSIGDGKIFDFYSVQSSEKLYLLARGTDMDTPSRIYIDIDENSATGYKATNWSQSGADYLIENEEVKRYTGTGNDWKWQLVGKAEVAKSYSNAEFAVKLDMLGLESPKQIKLGYVRNNTDCAPMAGFKMITANKTITGGSDFITILPNTKGDEFLVRTYAEADARCEFYGDIEPIDDPYFDDNYAYQKIKIGKSNKTSDVATVKLYLLSEEGEKTLLAEKSVIKHVVKKETITDIVKFYYKADFQGKEKIYTENELESNAKISTGMRLLIPTPEKLGDSEIPKYYFTILSTLGVIQLMDGVTEISKDPVNLATGSFLYNIEDYNTNGAFPISITRTYNSMDDYVGSFGRNWHFDYEMRLRIINGDAHITFGDGHLEIFESSELGGFISPPGRTTTLSYVDGGFVLTFAEGSYYKFDGGGNCTLVSDTNNNQTLLSYNENSRLSKVETSSGSISFTYNSWGLIDSATDQTGTTVQYEYTNEFLSSVTLPDGQKTNYEYNSDGYLNKMTDKEGMLLVYNEYDSMGRTIKQVFFDDGVMLYEYDDTNLTTTLTEQNGNKIIYYRDGQYRIYKTEYSNASSSKVFDDNNNLLSETNNKGFQWNFEYDNKRNLKKGINPLLEETSYEYNELNKLTKLTLPNGAQELYTYDNKGQMLTKTDPLGKTESYEYNDKGLLAKIIKNGETSEEYLKVDYDSKGNAVSITDGNNHTTTYTYDNSNRLVCVKLPEGNETSFSYTPTGKVETTTNALGETSTYTYDHKGNVKSFTDFAGNTTTYEYDAMSHLLRETNSLGQSTTYTYDLMWNVCKETDANGNFKTYEYDQLNRLTTSTDEKGNKTTYVYDVNGNVTEVQDPRNAVSKLAYDELNRVIEVIDPENGVSVTEYDNMGNIVKTKDPLGNENTKKYNAMNQVIESVTSNGAKTTYEYNNKDLLSKVTDANGNEYLYNYDGADNLIEIIQPTGKTIERIYDSNNRLVKVVGNDNREVNYVYDGKDRMTQITNPEGHTTLFAYDELDRLVRKTDANGSVTSYEYDSVGNLLKVVDAKDNEVTYNYDNMGNVLEMNVEQSLTAEEISRMVFQNTESLEPYDKTATTKYSYDKGGLLTTVADADGLITSYEYDANSNLIKKTDKNGSIKEYEYSLSNLLTDIRYGDGKTANYIYDSIGNLIEVNDWAGKTQIYYDNMGNITSVKDANDKEINYSYDILGNKTGMTYPNGSNVTYGYDVGNQLTNVINNNGTTSYQYDVMGKLLQKNLANGGQSVYNYDENGRLNMITNTSSKGDTDKYTYTYDSVGNIVQTSRIYNDSNETTTYSYDPIGQLKGVDNGTSNILYYYDSLGNRVREEEWLGDALVNETISCYDINNKLLNTLDTQGEKNYQYDILGNLTSETDGVGTILKKYEYNSQGMLSKYENNNGVVVNQLYDSRGERIGRTTVTNPDSDATFTEQFVIDITKPYDNLIGIYDSNGLNKEFTWGNNLISGTVSDNNTPSFEYNMTYYGDMLGTVSMLESADNTVKYSYDPWGNQKDVVDDVSTTGYNPFGYTGEYWDNDINIYYLRARTYDPQIGRMLSEDMAKIGSNWYIYCYNNPIKFIDATGLIPTPIEAAEMAKHIYSPSNKNNTLSGGWVYERSITGGDSLVMGVYSKISKGSKQEYALVNKGTSTKINSECRLNWKNNFQQIVGKSPDMFASLDHSESFIQEHYGFEVTMIGHSKGGAEAAANAVKNNTNAILFNPASVNLSELNLDPKDYKSDMTVFIISGEILNSIFGVVSKPIDKVIYLPPQHLETPIPFYDSIASSSATYLRISKFMDSIYSHSMEAMIFTLKKEGYK